MSNGIGGILGAIIAEKGRAEAEQVKSIKYELMGFCALIFLLVLLLALPGGQDVRSKIRTPAELLVSNPVVPPR